MGLKGRDMLFFMLLSFILLVPTFSCAATLTGHVYDKSLHKLNDVVVVVNSDPVQRYVVKNSTYVFVLPPGVYRLSARTFGDEEHVLGQDTDFKVDKEGTFVFDLVLELLPESERNQSISTSISNSLGKDNQWFDAKTILRITDSLVVILLILVVAYFGYKYFKRKAKVVDEEDGVEVDENTKKVLAIIKKEKQITQKNIRKNFDLSEAKISLILTDLENQNLIKRIKKGRGNVIIFNPAKK